MKERRHHRRSFELLLHVRVQHARVHTLQSVDGCVGSALLSPDPFQHDIVVSIRWDAGWMFQRFCVEAANFLDRARYDG